MADLTARLRALANEFFMPLEPNRDFLTRVDMERRNPSNPGDAGEDFDTAFDEFASRTAVIGLGGPYHPRRDGAED